MEYNGWGSPATVKQEAATDSQRRLYCDACGGDDFDGGDDGFFYCRQCGSQSQDVIDTATADEDIHADGGGLYSFFLTRARPHPQNPNPNPKPPSKADILKVLSQSLSGKSKEEEAERPPYGFDDDDKGSEPRDFGSGSVSSAGALADGIRKRYVEGLQVMLQLQCEALVEKFGASPLICGMAGTIWLRYLAESRVFEEGWAERVIAESEAVVRARDAEEEKPKRRKRVRRQYRSEPHNSYGQRAIFIWLRSLRKTVPLYSSLAISFLVCYLAREAILPTDIFKWVSEGELPYISVFVDMDKLLGNPSSACPLSSRLLFRPVRVIGADQLEATSGSIAELIGLRIPSVNFYAIAQRFLKELYLPVDKILPHACQLYSWAFPAELWLSSNALALPSRVCVMSLLIVTIRIWYDINGQGIWEMSKNNLRNTPPHNRMVHLTPDSENLNSKLESEYGDGDVKEHHDAAGPGFIENLSRMEASEYDTKELLGILESSFDKMNLAQDYGKDMMSYLNYCKDIVFAGITTSYEEERLIERFREIYDKQEDDIKKEQIFDVKVKRPRDGVSTNSPDDPKEQNKESQGSLYAHKEIPMKKTSQDNFVNNSTSIIEPPVVPNCSTSGRNAAVERLKLRMEENGFQYLPPRVQQRTDGYLHYKRQKIDGKLIYVAHADYYILLQACARVAQVDVRTMHLGVLKLERRLSWCEQQIDRSLASLPECLHHQNGKERDDDDCNEAF